MNRPPSQAAPITSKLASDSSALVVVKEKGKSLLKPNKNFIMFIAVSWGIFSCWILPDIEFFEEHVAGMVLKCTACQKILPPLGENVPYWLTRMRTAWGLSYAITTAYVAIMVFLCPILLNKLNVKHIKYAPEFTWVFSVGAVCGSSYWNYYPAVEYFLFILVSTTTFMASHGSVDHFGFLDVVVALSSLLLVLVPHENRFWEHVVFATLGVLKFILPFIYNLVTASDISTKRDGEKF